MKKAFFHGKYRDNICGVSPNKEVPMELNEGLPVGYICKLFKKKL